MADAASSRIESGVIEVLKHVSRRPIEPTLSSDQFRLPLGDVVLVPGGTIGRTTSGKVRRTALRDSYFRGELGAAVSLYVVRTFRSAPVMTSRSAL